MRPGRSGLFRGRGPAFTRTRLLIMTLSLSLASAQSLACQAPLAVQVLGSGGPIADDARASSGYLLWMDGKARLLVDAGGGTARTFGASGARIEDLEGIVLTHLHTDHSSDLVNLVKSAYFSERSRDLPVLGPTEGGRFPGIAHFLEALLAPDEGAYRYLSEFLDGEGAFVLKPEAVDAGVGQATRRQLGAGMSLRLIGVAHGPVPALGVVVEVDGKTVAFSGDQNNDNPAFAEAIEGVDLLVMHHAIAQASGRIARNLHATPRHIGRMAAASDVQGVLLSHLMQRSLRALPESRRHIRDAYDGPLTVAEDGHCYAVSGKAEAEGASAAMR